MNSIIFITFDIKKDDYPAMSYSIASLMASLKSSNLCASHYSVDLQHSLLEVNKDVQIIDAVKVKLSENISYFKKFDFIAISLTAWSIDYCKYLLDQFDNYPGKIIFGGYEVTSMSNSQLYELFPKVDYFIKGFAEKALKKITDKSYSNEIKFINEKIENDDLASPYLSGILSLSSKKIHWETKRGCPYKCGFCEWGNATKNIVEIDKKRLFAEIKLFESSCIDEINILDGTFNFGKNYISLLKELLKLKDVRLTFQARLENLLNSEGEEFITLCSKNRERIHIEFGLQTIHKKEMETIGRKNDLDKVKKALILLRENKIDFEVSIIYAIPGQTVVSFIDTIEFLISNGCKNIRAFPLRIPHNSILESKKNEYCVSEKPDEYDIFSVMKSYSFPPEQREDMDVIAERLNSGKLITDIDSIPFDYKPENFYKYKFLTTYQWEILECEPKKINNEMLFRLISDYLALTLADIGKEDFFESMNILGHARLSTFSGKGGEFINDIISGKITFGLGKKKKFNLNDKEFDKLYNKRNNPKEIEKQYRCKMSISKSSNIYFYREVIN